MKKIYLPLLLGLLAGLCGCGGDDGTSPPPWTRTWVAIEPIQCMGNPWEQDWLARNDNDYLGYPRQPGLGLTPEEIEIIKEYYGRQGIGVLAVSFRVYPGDVCAACSCSAGYTLFLLVPGREVETMLSL